jgi:hypothetical protein
MQQPRSAVDPSSPDIALMVQSQPGRNTAATTKPAAPVRFIKHAAAAVNAPIFRNGDAPKIIEHH